MNAKQILQAVVNRQIANGAQVITEQPAARNAVYSKDNLDRLLNVLKVNGWTPGECNRFCDGLTLEQAIDRAQREVNAINQSARDNA